MGPAEEGRHRGLSGKGFGKWRVQQGTERSELPGLFLEGGRHNGESLLQPNRVPLVLLPLGQSVPALPPAPCLSTAGPGIPDKSWAVQCGTAWGEETGQSDALQPKLEGLNMFLMFCAGHSSILSSHLPLVLADPAGQSCWMGMEGLLLGFAEQHHGLSRGLPVHEGSTSHPPSHGREACLQAAPAALWDLGCQSCSTQGR